MNPIIVIPSRLGSHRLPGKPLADICGLPMIVHVQRRAAAVGIGRTVVATPDQEIYNVVSDFGGEAILTEPDLQSGTDRVRRALDRLDPLHTYEPALNVQGDMPLISRLEMSACLNEMSRGDCHVATLASREHSPEDRANPSVVKVIATLLPGEASGRALYFTRSTLYGAGPILRHIGIYGYRRGALESITTAPPSQLELRENLEQLRILEMGLQINVGIVDRAAPSVDTAVDLAKVRKFMAEQDLEL